MSTHYKSIVVMTLVLALLAGCGKSEPTATAVPPTHTPLPPTAAPSVTPVPPTAPPTAPPSSTMTITATAVATTPTETPTSTPTETPTDITEPTATAPPAEEQRESPAPFPDLEAKAEVRTYGGEHNDAAYDILILADGGTLMVGRANSPGPSHRITPGTARLIRTDAEGNVIWQKDYGGEIDTMFYSPIQTGEDEYVVLGQIAASYARQETDFYLVKIDGEGNEIWSHTYGGHGMDIAKMVRQTADGGFILVGGRADEFPTKSPSGYLYQGDIVLIKTDAVGNEVWTRTYGDKILYLGWGVAQTPDGGYVLIGWEAKTIPDRDVIAIKTDETGNVEWSRTWDLDPKDRDGGFDLILTADGHIVIAGIQSMDSGVRGAVLIKVDLDGNEIWVKVLGEEGVDNEFWDILQDSDGGYVVAGATLSGKNPTTGEKIRRGLIIKTDPDGETLWQYVFDADEYELTHFSSAVTLPDGGYIFVGQAIRKGETYLDMLWLKISGEEYSSCISEEESMPMATTETPTSTPSLEVISSATADQVELLSTLSGHNDRVKDLVFSGDGAFLASSSLDKTIKLWDVVNWQEVHTFSVIKVGFNGIALSQDGRLLASADAIWYVESKQMAHTLERSRWVPGPVAFSPNGSILAVALESQPIKLWDVASGEVLRTFVEQTDDVTFSIAFSPDGILLAAGVHGGIVRLWIVASGQIAGTLEYGNESDVHDVAFSPNGKVLASAGNDNTVRLWDVRSGELVHTLWHGNGLYGVAFSPDGSLVASACCDRTVKLWDVASGKLLHSLRHGDEVITVTFSPDGMLLASGGYDNQIYLWGVSR